MTKNLRNIIISILLMLIVAIIIFLVCFFNKSKNDAAMNTSKDLNQYQVELSKQINDLLGSSSVYYSADGTSMFIEIRDWDNENNEKLQEVIKILKNDASKNNIKLITITTYINDNSKTNYIVIRNMYDTERGNIGEQETYIDFDTVSNIIDN